MTYFNSQSKMRNFLRIRSHTESCERILTRPYNRAVVLPASPKLMKLCWWNYQLPSCLRGIF